MLLPTHRKDNRAGVAIAGTAGPPASPKDHNTVRHVVHLSQATAERLFHRPPQTCGHHDDPDTIAIIHPTHVAAVHALSVVTHEQFSDATDILGGDAAGGGVRRGNYANKMDEITPHRAWALKTLRRAHVCGVTAEAVTFVGLLEASIHSAEDSPSSASPAPSQMASRVEGQQVPA